MVSEQNSKFAPAGYGLGEAAKLITDWNNATENGWYAAATNTPTGYMMYGFVVKYSDNYIIQTVWSISSVTGVADKAQRVKAKDGWQPWEWVTPPMNLGVEYRTTERWQGKPVYTMLVDCGALPDNSTKNIGFATVNYNCFDLKVYVRNEDTTNTMHFPIFSYNDGSILARACIYAGQIVQITTFKELSHYYAYAIVKYTKD